MALAWLAYPLLLLALCGGLGLLVDAASGRRLPGALVVPVGLCALLTFATLAGLAGASVGAVSTGVILLVGIGVATAMPWRFGRLDPWAVAAPLAAFTLFAAPVVFSGDPTFAVYGSEAEIGTWLEIGASDPVGAIWPLAVAQRPLGGELAWHLQPYLAFLLAMPPLAAWQIAGRADALAAGPRAAVAFLAVTPVVVFGYADWGGVQQLAALATLSCAAAVAPRRVPLALALLATALVLTPFSPLELDTGTWLETAGLAAFAAAATAVSLWVAAGGSTLLFALVAVALTGSAIAASASATLAPYDSLSELGEIDERFAGQGPALLFEDNPYGAYFLRDLDPSERRPADPDRVQFKQLLKYPLLVVPRSPALSRPALPYKRRYLGNDYEVWKLPRNATFRLLFHMGIGEPGAPVARPDCSQTVGLGLLALANQLGATPQEILLVGAGPGRGGRLGKTVAVPPSEARKLCGRPWDWIEAIATG